MFSVNFERWNLILGWVVFTVALIVYSMTVEPTVSFWDCGEYIAASTKLQIAHPPGAPFLQMVGAFISLFSYEPSDIAKMVNYVAVISSAFTILFLFWTTTNLVSKLCAKSKVSSNHKSLIILGSGVVGALTFTFSDSFWFNATETEVYAMASLIMALLLWLGLKWTDNLEESRGNRWLLLIAFLTGLTSGIQFMGFLAIPSIGMLYYFKKYKTTVKSFLLANIVSVAMLLLVFKFSLPYVLRLFWLSELFFVNDFGLPFNSGSIIMALVFILIFYVTIRYTRKKKLQTANTVTLCLLFLFLGFSPLLMLSIRASAHVNINEGDPSDAHALLAYYNREQYPGPDSPFYGAYFTDMFADADTEKDDRPKYERDSKSAKYIIVNHYKNALRGANAKHKGMLPRMWSEQNAEDYIRYYGGLEFSSKSKYRSNTQLQDDIKLLKENYKNGNIDAAQYIGFLKERSNFLEVQPPSIWANIKYMLQYQFGYMYVRYFMWNFVGRKNDIQGRFDGNGEWLSGIKFIDSLRLGSQENLPSEVLNNKGRNTYFFLPLLLGIIGVLCQINKNPKQFWTMFLFFIFTGLAIQFYTNPTIFQPRERDYSLVGSFYIFAIWIGIGVYGLFDAFRSYIKPRLLAPISIASCILAVPSLMAFQNWDDHDRSDRFTALAMSKAYLDSTAKDAGSILFTIGDNDTFPLWYAQEVEGYRTDTRIAVTTYLGTDWYIDQMKRESHLSEAIPSQLSHEKYRYGSRDAIYYQPLTENRWSIKDFMNWVSSDHPKTKIKSLVERNGGDVSAYSESYLDVVFYPTNKIRIPVDKEKVLESGLVKQKDAEMILDYIDIDLPKTAIGKGKIIMLDIIANNDWERPIYFSGGSFDDEEYIWMKDYLQLDGLVYKLVPIKTENEHFFERGRIDTDLMYDIVTKWEWGNSGSAEIYHDPQTRRQAVTFRSNLARLLESLLQENKIEKAKRVIDIAMTNIPFEHYNYYSLLEPFLDGYYKVGEMKKARNLYQKLKNVYQERLTYSNELPLEEQYLRVEDIISNLQSYRRNIDILIENEEEMTQKEI